MKQEAQPRFTPTPAFSTKVMRGEQSVQLLDGSRVVTANLRQVGFQFRYPMVQSALEDSAG